MPGLDDFLPPPPWEGPPLPRAFLATFQLTPHRIALVQEVNNEIRKRRNYGRRREVVARIPFQKLSWSNASASWWRQRGRERVPATERAKDLQARYQRGDHSKELFRQLGQLGWEDYRLAKAGDSVSLGANEILVYAAALDIDIILQWLEPLPLYAYSFEAKERGVFDLKGWLEALYRQWKMGEE